MSLSRRSFNLITEVRFLLRKLRDFSLGMPCEESGGGRDGEHEEAEQQDKDRDERRHRDHAPECALDVGETEHRISAPVGKEQGSTKDPQEGNHGREKRLSEAQVRLKGMRSLHALVLFARGGVLGFLHAVGKEQELELFPAGPLPVP